MSKTQTMKKPNPQQGPNITSFQGYYSFLSNDYPTWVFFQGLNFPSVSTAYQAARTQDQRIRQKIANVSDTEQFKKIAMSIQNPSDWGQRKQKIMTNLIRDKFKRNKQILDKLIATKEKKLVNGMKNGGFNEEYWGVYDGKGKNVLGKILMNIRSQFEKGLDTKNWIESNLGLEEDVKMCANVSILVLKDGKKVERLNLDKNKNYYLFGSLKTTDFHLQNPTISRNHACLYFSDLQVMIVDLKSTHGTFIKRKGQQQKLQLEALVGYRLYKDDTIQFGTSVRQYVVDIDRAQVENYIAQQEKDLKQNIKSLPQKLTNPQQYFKMSKEQVKGLLGIQRKCILLNRLQESDNYHRLKEYFSKFEKVKDLRFKVNKKTGKNEGTAIIYFEGPNSACNVMDRSQQITYQMKLISQKQADIQLQTRHVVKSRRSKSRSQQSPLARQQSRSRSRQKKEKRKK